MILLSVAAAAIFSLAAREPIYLFSVIAMRESIELKTLTP
jgi:hypothetical protein